MPKSVIAHNKKKLVAIFKEIFMKKPITYSSNNQGRFNIRSADETETPGLIGGVPTQIDQQLVMLSHQNRFSSRKSLFKLIQLKNYLPGKHAALENL